MNNDERDAKLNQIHDVSIRMERMVEEHHITLYGNGQPGIVKKLVLFEERQTQCPARKAGTTENKRTNIAMAMMVIGIISVITSIVLALVK